MTEESKPRTLEPGLARMIEEFRLARERRMLSRAKLLWMKAEAAIRAAGMRVVPDTPDRD